MKRKASFGLYFKTKDMKRKEKMVLNHLSLLLQV